MHDRSGSGTECEPAQHIEREARSDLHPPEHHDRREEERGESVPDESAPGKDNGLW
jgi:hypothetical protein